MLASLGCFSVSGRGSRPMARREFTNYVTRLLRSGAFWDLIILGIQDKDNNSARGRPPRVFRGWLRCGDVVRPGAGIGVIAARCLAALTPGSIIKGWGACRGRWRQPFSPCEL